MPIIQLVSDETNRRLALRHSISHHLKLSDDNKSKGSFFIHRHHFSIVGWSSSSKQKTALIDATLARKWDDRLGRKAYYDKINSMEYIIQDQLNR